jgi:hypothetical protein
LTEKPCELDRVTAWRVAPVVSLSTASATAEVPMTGADRREVFEARPPRGDLNADFACFFGVLEN